MIDGFQIGPLYVRFYGIILMLGAVTGAWLATREARRRGYDPEIVWDLLIYLIVGGVIGARLWHIFTPSPSVLIVDPVTGQMVNPYFAGGTIKILDILSIWRGGLGIPGGIIGGVIALYFYARKHKLHFAEWADIAAPSLALGQAIGRFGNYFNQELYGAPTNLPWKLYIDPAHRLPGYENVDYFHPLFAYEAILNLANMFFLIWVTRRFADKLKRGDVFLTYLVIYPTVRFFLEFLRLDASQVAGVNANQTVAAAVAIVAAGALFWRHRSTESGAQTSGSIRRPAERPSGAVARKSPARKKPVSKKAVKKTTPRKSSAKKKTA